MNCCRPKLSLTARKRVWILCAACATLFFTLRSQESVIERAPVEIESIKTPFPMTQLRRPIFPQRDFDIRAFGAVPGGTFKNTQPIRKAISAAALSGGGRIVIPEGTWLTGPIHLESNINLHLSKGATLLFSQDKEDYLPAVFSRHEDTECYKYSAFVYAAGKNNIAITGEGTLDGQGKPWWTWKNEKKNSEERLVEIGNKNVPVKERVFDGRNGNDLRPAFFQPMNCRNVFVEGVHFLYGAFWTITPTYCENVIVRKVRITTEGSYGHTPNGDGVDPSSSRNVLIEYCEFDTGDDCIAVKSGRDTDGLRVGKPSENIVIRHCVGLQGHGGIVIGSETSGGIRNVYAYDCAFNGTDRIVRIKTARGRGGALENMWFEHCSADTILREALHVNMLYTGTRLPEQARSKTTPTIRNIHFSDITCVYGKSYGLEILGLPESLAEDITFDRIKIHSAQGVHCVDARSVSLNNIDIVPDHWPVVEITDSDNITIDRLSVPKGADPLITVKGPKARNITVRHTATAAATKVLLLGPDVGQKAVDLEE